MGRSDIDITQPDGRQTEAALQRILSSAAFQNAPLAARFLEYVVREELAGRGARIKAYTIAVDALNRPQSFDPASDPSVRVMARRVRAYLDTYYLTIGNTDSVRISLPKGGYRPSIVFQNLAGAPSGSAATHSASGGPSAADRGDSGARPETRHQLVLGLAIVMLVISLITIFYTFRPTPSSRDQSGALNPPVVEIAPFVHSGNTFSDQLIQSIRLQLTDALSRFGHLQILQMSDRPDEANAREPDFLISGTLVEQEQRALLLVTVNDVEEQTVVDSVSASLPQTQSPDFESKLSSAIATTAAQIGEIDGAIAAQIRRELFSRIEEAGGDGLSDFQCVMLTYFRMQDEQSRDADVRAIADSCLADLIAQDPINR